MKTNQNYASALKEGKEGWRKEGAKERKEGRERRMKEGMRVGFIKGKKNRSFRRASRKAKKQLRMSSKRHFPTFKAPDCPWKLSLTFPQKSWMWLKKQVVQEEGSMSIHNIWKVWLQSKLCNCKQKAAPGSVYALAAERLQHRQRAASSKGFTGCRHPEKEQWPK